MAFDPDGSRETCVEANPAVLNLLGMQRKNLVGHPIGSFIQRGRTSKKLDRLLGRKHDHGED